MKKFSKKLVSRCVYCNVLQATKPGILSEFLDKGGWETINIWLSYAKSATSSSFLVEMLKLCKLLPMTLERLKENNTAKVIKSLTKHENNDVKSLSGELVTHWMAIIKGQKAIDSTSAVKKKKKEKFSKAENAKEDVKKSPKPEAESSKVPKSIKGLKRTSTEKEIKKVVDDIYEDVKIDPEPLLPVSKKPRTDRPKTAKIYQKKFRATGLEEETPLPKNISKKTTTVDKSAIAAAKNAFKMNPSSLDRITEKKIKPESLMTVSENTKGIKVIPAKPRPTYVLHESASFMDALISQPVAAVKRKKKVSAKAAISPTRIASSPTANATSPTTTPTSPTMQAPKFQFYKDTLEMNDESKKDELEMKEDEESSEVKAEETVPNTLTEEENVPMDTTEEGGHTPTNEEESNEISSPTNSVDSKNEEEQREPFDPNHLRSILSHGRRRGKKKNVQWAEDTIIKEIFYFDMDDTERVNVSRQSNFYDLKSFEMKSERETMEQAKRGTSEKVEVLSRWWTVPILSDCPPPPVEPGSNSTEKHVEILRQQSTLQEIYFTREMIPDSPHEPDLEIHAPKEPIVIPFDENNVISALNDYSNCKHNSVTNMALPDILATLMKVTTSQPLILPGQSLEQPSQMPMDSVPSMPLPLMIPDPMNLLHPEIVPLPHSQPYEPSSELLLPRGPLPNGLMGHAPLPFVQPVLKPPIGLELPPGDWRTIQDVSSPTDQFYGGFPPLMNQNMPPNQLPPHTGGNIRPPPGGPNIRPNFRGAPGMGPRPQRRTICRHFRSNHCRFGMKCSFLHPGVNGPPR